MSILILSPDAERIIPAFEKTGDNFHVLDGPITPADIPSSTSYIICYKYQHILSKPFIDSFNGLIINLHISYLPWNKGSDPNFWSFYHNTPKGVTIHQLTENIDAGPIYCQQKIEFDQDETLKTSYTKLCLAMEQFFIASWPDIKNGDVQPMPQTGEGSFNLHKDFCKIFKTLDRGWDTPTHDITQLGQR